MYECIIISLNIHTWKNNFVEVSKHLIRYKSENNFVGSKYVQVSNNASNGFDILAILVLMSYIILIQQNYFQICIYTEKEFC